MNTQKVLLERAVELKFGQLKANTSTLSTKQRAILIRISGHSEDIYLQEEQKDVHKHFHASILPHTAPHKVAS